MLRRSISLEEATPAAERVESRPLAYAEQRRRYWDEFSSQGSERWAGLRRYYFERLAVCYRFLIPKGSRVLELGCGQGDLLAALEPANGVGVDFSGRMLERARERYPRLRFVEGAVHQLELEAAFDYIILSDLVNDVWDVQRVLGRALRHCHRDTRIILNTYSRVWEIPRRIAERLGTARPQLAQNWLTTGDLENLLDLSGFEMIRVSAEVLVPLRVPLLADLANRYLIRLWPLRWFALTWFLIARPKASRPAKEPVVSVVVAARNEEGNIPAIFRRVPRMGARTELIFVEGGSSDGTWAAVEREMARNPHVPAKLLRQPGKGKGDAVRAGFQAAEGDILMILDADMTVAPEDLPRFYEALRDGTAEFANGVRLVYPMQEEAMRFFNHFGNRFFSMAFSWLLGQRIKDTLCGTKVLSRAHYQQIANNRAYFGEFDPFGDFDLIFGAAKLNLKIVDVPVRYHERTYGETNIQRWRHGMILLRMVLYAMRRIKFV